MAVHMEADTCAHAQLKLSQPSTFNSLASPEINLLRIPSRNDFITLKIRSMPNTRHRVELLIDRAIIYTDAKSEMKKSGAMIAAAGFAHAPTFRRWKFSVLRIFSLVHNPSIIGVVNGSHAEGYEKGVEPQRLVCP